MIEDPRLQEGERRSPFYISTAVSIATYRPRVLKFGNSFAVLDHFGDIQATGPSEQGLFFNDTRFLSHLSVSINGVRPLLLSSAVTEDNFTLEADLTNPDLLDHEGIRLPKDTLHILRTAVLGNDAMFQSFSLRNFGTHPIGFEFALAFDADFADIFEVRGTERARHGTMLPDEGQTGERVVSYLGLDKVNRRTRVTFEPEPGSIERRRAVWQIELEPGARMAIEFALHCEQDGLTPSCVSLAESNKNRARFRADRKARAAAIESSNGTFNDWVRRSRADLDLLITETPNGPYAYAGIPWFSTAFGRDGIITALQCLWFDPTLAAGTLRYLAEHQATETDPQADAEPGKILHETRRSEMAATGEVPFGRYYGSVDATPLFVMLAAAYHARTGDTDLIRDIWPNLEAALAWIARHSAQNVDGFLTYDRKSMDGLVNQGWKDSGDAVFHADGRLAEAPIALAEVQAYVYGAWQGAAKLAVALGHDHRATDFSGRADAMRQRFDAAFWLDELGTYALALDGSGRPCQVRASNAGHVLLSGLALHERAETLAASLMAPASFSDWGIRTIAETEARYNPMSYHNGSIWPHDNALIAIGFGRYRLHDQMLALMTGLYDTAASTDLKRLPELFCGFPRRPGASPTAYPVACSPQAWSSAAVFGVLGAALGISFEPENHLIRFTQPVLPPWLDDVLISNLQLAGSTVDLRVSRRDDGLAVDVIRQQGPMEIALLP